MNYILSNEAMRASDAHTIQSGTPGKELMFRAGKGIFDVLIDQFPWIKSIPSKDDGLETGACETTKKCAGHAFPRIAVVCGSGNNAGDGYVVAEMCREQGIDVTIFLTSDRFSEDGRYYFDACVKLGIEIRQLFSGSATDPSDDRALNKPAKFDTSAEAENQASNPNIGTPSSKEENPLTEYDLVLDCLLGTGFFGDLKPPYSRAIQMINESGAAVVSVDINSGVHGDSGLPSGDIKTSYSRKELKSLCVCSDLTISIGSYQPGHFLGIAKDVMKQRVNVDIGITPLFPPLFLLEPEDFVGCIPKRAHYSNKSTYGYLTLIGGSKLYPGAIKLSSMSLNASIRSSDGTPCGASIQLNASAPLTDDNSNSTFEHESLALCADAAMRSGAGVVRIALPKSLAPYVTQHILESTIFPLSENQDGDVVFTESEIDDLMKHSKSIAFGMGIGLSKGSADILKYLLLHYEGILIVDADGLTHLADLEEDVLERKTCTLVITPHIKEFARILRLEVRDVLENPIETAQTWKRGIVLLKGPTTVICDGKHTLLVPAGCPGMATAGSGDVLSGILLAMLANANKLDILGQVQPLLFATALSVYIAGRAGKRAEQVYGDTSMIARDTVAQIPSVIVELQAKEESK